MIHLNFKELADLLFADVSKTYTDLEREFPPRDLPEGAAVTRIAPSPTGFMHFGTLFPAITSERLAHQSGGVFYLRIEDTDEKREVEGAVEVIIDSLIHYGIKFDEGVSLEGEIGDYGPYSQRQRKDIYHIIAKKLVEEGHAYPCFCTEEELAETRRKQEEQKLNFGYYGDFAIYRNSPIELIKEKLAEGLPYVLRFRSTGSLDKKIKHFDLIKGELELTENDIDHVLLKSDGIPTYHFAHAVDDHFMRTTHVVRGDEWLSTLPFHLQLFDTLGWKRPKYMHISPLMKMDGDSRRKLSKRKDPEAALTYYKQEGFPIQSVYEYVLNTLNSNFEDWRRANRTEPAEAFKFSYKKMSPSGALFDIDKLMDISKNVVAAMTAEEVYTGVSEWAEEFAPRFFSIFTERPDYTANMLRIGRGGKKPRKDLALWSEFQNYLSFFFDDLFEPDYSYPENFSNEKLVQILEEYMGVLSVEDDNTQWFDKVKGLSVRHGCCTDMKQYRQDPTGFSGSVADVSMVLRVAICGRQQSPDLCEVMKVMGRDLVDSRIMRAIENIKSRGSS